MNKTWNRKKKVEGRKKYEPSFYLSREQEIKQKILTLDFDMSFM